MSNAKTLLIFICLALLLAACAGPGPASTPTPPVNTAAEEAAVYAAIVRERFSGEAIKLLVIQAETSPGIDSGGLEETLDRIKGGLPGLSRQTLEDFRARNQQAHNLPADLQLGVPYVLITLDEQGAILNGSGGWDAFYARYPNSQGTMTLSRVGFNRAMDQALVYVGNMSYALAGAGYYYLMAKKDGAWTIQSETMAWIS